MKKHFAAISLAFSVLCASMPCQAAAEPIEITTMDEVADSLFDDIMESSPVNLHFTYMDDNSYDIPFVRPIF